ncbi:acetylglutamate kinase [Blattabacterium cuenoti]|uniref:acetylglutamate kinase n=1 Tax=Blattabacterium cuenoti TaxID=1653831 RepID=UPI00163C8DBB|nr:acetylglutamate kinase [Blattabacterium cuenoti]
MKIHIVKIGGQLINDRNVLKSSIKHFCELQGHKILVHGGGKKADLISKKMGIHQKMIEGRRKTDRDTLDIVVMTYAGMINKNIVALLQYYHCNAIGLCGADGNCMRSSLREKKTIDYGYVGDLSHSSINSSFLTCLLKHQITPVLCPITHDGMGQLLNTNADTIASYIAISLAKYYTIDLHFCFEKKGVLRDMKDSESYFHTMDFHLFQKIKKNHLISHGMRPKLENAFIALQHGVDHVSIGMTKYLNEVNNKTILCL